MLADHDRAPAERLPDTGVGADLESALSAKFIDIPGYGTRASTILRIGHDGHGEIVERRYGWRGKQRGTSRIEF